MKPISEHFAEFTQIEAIEKCQQDAALLIETRLTAMGQEIEEMENSVFSRELKMRLSGKFDGLPENVKKMFGAAVPEIQKRLMMKIP